MIKKVSSLKCPLLSKGIFHVVVIGDVVIVINVVFVLVSVLVVALTVGIVVGLETYLLTYGHH